MGFKTFDKWWDESYDNDNSHTKIKKIADIIEELHKKDVNELKMMYNEMMPILKHNKNLLQNFHGLGRVKKELENE